ncbi:major facilitator superfamily domain-containing protein [Neohortaea acidophila]|uniref:Major facilitator superfamily domain-containing protein n=1 Tax=Neohortaea acidophila TaxID=245834 RepID=A0A6A6PWJ4_9PEZI|nr:major facilitator superfamily domain-containing protein [Neohortaea acidophila]KAF2484136.1 major facilitator superfamily domain-containing protein [Neohortaea acidophila]
MPRIFPKLTATALQATTYLLGIALFSIAFLVFLNSSISFVITDIIGRKHGVGDAAGSLGFADELLALVACPAWGLISDRVGVRFVAVFGYCVIGLSLIGLVQAENVYPELLVARLMFSIGGAACSTMVTAVLPAMIAEKTVVEDDGQKDAVEDKTAGASQLAGFVGLFTGAGALVALAVFLPMPAYFQAHGQSQEQSLRYAFYIVAAVAFCVAIFIFVGLRNLPGEEGKKLSALFQTPYNESSAIDHEGHVHITLTPAPSYLSLIKDSVKLGLTDSTIFLGYLGGFVARASSVAISLFIPLFVNAYFRRHGLCNSDADNIPDIKKNCERAYGLASALSGVAETAALICAPLFGWLGGRAVKGSSEWPLSAAAAIGVGGYVAFGLLRNPDAFHGEGGEWAFLAVILIGISQIGCIVCSLALLGRGINKDEQTNRGDDAAAKHHSIPSAVGPSTILTPEITTPTEPPEDAPLLWNTVAKHKRPEGKIDRSRLKGSIAGVYSFAGGAGILLLTKLGGALFDSWTPGAPFFLMAAFNAGLLVAVVVVGGIRVARQRRRKGSDDWERTHRD